MPVSKTSRVTKKTTREFAGHWAIATMDEFDDGYFELGDAPPHLALEKPDKFKAIRGEYVIGLSNGTLEGALREFGGETIVVFGHEGMDEMDFVNGGGWLRLTGPNTLEGEFVGGLGRFEAHRGKSPTRRK